MAQTAFPPPDYMLGESTIEGIEVYVPRPIEEAEQKEVIDFKCPQCGSITAFSATDGGLTCTSCGYYEPPQAEIVGKGAEEFEFTVETLHRAAHGWGEERKELQCQSCGVYTAVEPESLTHTCAFCGSNNVIQRKSPQEVLRPRFLIPFKIEADDCVGVTREWLGSSWMTPGELQNLAMIANFTGVYIPMWTFDSRAKAKWKAEVGHKKTKRYYSGGKWRTKTVIVWKWESGNVNLYHDDVLISGTTHLSQVLLERIKNYNLHDLAPYEPTYLAGFQAQAYDIDLESAWEQGRHEMRERTRMACRAQASTNRIRNFSMGLDFSEESWRHILLPIYLANYKYDTKNYQVMVNGQTGNVSGQRPVAWWKVWLACFGLVSPGLLLGLVALVLLITGSDAGMPVGIFGFIVLVAGAIFALGIIRGAYAMDDI